MQWNWQQPDWLEFTYKPDATQKAEQSLQHGSGILFGAYKHLNDDCKSSETMRQIAA